MYSRFSESRRAGALLTLIRVAFHDLLGNMAAVAHPY
jgi:hypothetical protein